MNDDFPNPLSVSLKRWVAFLWGLSLLSALAFGIIPWVSSRVAPDMMRQVRASGIDPSGLFYTESQVAGEAFNHFENRRIRSNPR